MTDSTLWAVLAAVALLLQLRTKEDENETRVTNLDLEMAYSGALERDARDRRLSRLSREDEDRHGWHEARQ